MQIILIRHGQPQVSFPTWVSGDEFLQCMMAYQRSELSPNSCPPAAVKALVKKADAVFTSDLPRSSQSARRLLPAGTIIRSSLFREPDFERLNLPQSIRLPYFAWKLTAFLLWALDSRTGKTARQESRARAQAAARYLVEQAKTLESVALVGHDITHRFIAEELRRLGWRGPRSPVLDYWSYSVYGSPAQPSGATQMGQPDTLTSDVLEVMKATFTEVTPDLHRSDCHGLSQDTDDLAQTLSQALLRDRKFSLADAIGREGSDLLKGESTIPRPLRAMAQVNLFIVQHLKDAPGALEIVLKTWAKTDARMSQHLDDPLTALRKILVSIVENDQTLYEFSRQVNVAWGELQGERPYFQVPGQPPHAKAVYSHGSVRETLCQLLEVLISTQE